MKKVFIVLFVFMMFGISANAQISKEDSNISVVYTELADKAFDTIMYVFEPGVDLSDGEIDDEDMQKLFKMEQRNEVTEFKYNFTLQADDPEGIYYVVIGGFEEKKPLSERSDCFVHLRSDTETQIVSELNSAEDSNALKAVYEKYNKFAWLIDKENEQYKQDVDAFYNVMYDNFGKCFVNAADSEIIFNKTATLVDFSNLKGDELIQAIKTLGLTDSIFYEENFEQVATLYEKYTNKGSSINELKKTLSEAIAVTEVNMSDSNVVLDVLKKYFDIFSVNFEGNFPKVSETQMARALYHKDFVRAKDVDDAFNNRLQQLISQVSSVSGSAGGGISNYGGSHSAIISQGIIDSNIIKQLKGEEIFFDIDECEWAADYIKGVYRRQIMIGSDGYFRPNDFLTREELVKIILLAKELDIENDADRQFNDVKKEDWFYQYVMTAVKNQIVFGIDKTTFGTGMTVSRQDAAVMLYRAFADNDLNEDENISTFNDSTKIADYAKKAVMWMQKKSIISGFPDNTFRPEDGLTRAQAAKIIFELIQ
ncbi:S-layer homology domain-containing protein [Ructibacterium gallinarum]|uniref:S-layer homology domain-containing protein n=1 Tax=Ructibacterium gallinarum TaxID=2779355 RepID=A0A9D5M1T0_9FIRM|nr:S-layer homology domain-containing protein [Ructibacterium gallinarum]MBE5040566.1 S-layer homology domain-containing protein [Ructibacterium gallinarum]